MFFRRVTWREKSQCIVGPCDRQRNNQYGSSLSQSFPSFLANFYSIVFKVLKKDHCIADGKELCWFDEREEVHRPLSITLTWRGISSVWEVHIICGWHFGQFWQKLSISLLATGQLQFGNTLFMFSSSQDDLLEELKEPCLVPWPGWSTFSAFPQSLHLHRTVEAKTFQRKWHSNGQDPQYLRVINWSDERCQQQDPTWKQANTEQK